MCSSHGSNSHTTCLTPKDLGKAREDMDRSAFDKGKQPVQSVQHESLVRKATANIRTAPSKWRPPTSHLVSYPGHLEAIKSHVEHFERGLKITSSGLNVFQAFKIQIQVTSSV